MGLGTKVGQAETEIVTTKDLLVRLQAPRFFVEKDEVVLSANVHNKLKNKKAVQVVLELDGSVLQPLGETAQTVEIAAGSEHRVDWRVKVAHEGQAVIRMKALTDEESDAAQMTFPAYVHGMLKMEAFAGAIRPDQEKAQVVLRVPAERKPDQSRLEVRYSPTLAGALVDALPYLADYPYGCTEQTLNRFLPTVITQKVLINLGLDLKAIRDKHTNLNAQQLGDARERAKQWKGYEHNPVFDQAEVAKMAGAGIQRLADMQLSDGGWGWFSGYGEFASPHTTALVVHGLQVARQNDLALPEGMLERGVAWLTDYQAKQVRLLENGVSQVKPYKTSADDHRRPGVHGPDRRRGPQRPDARLPGSRSHPSLGLCEGDVRPGAGADRREGQAGGSCSRTSASMSSGTTRTRRPTSSFPTRVTGGRGTAARSRPTRSTSSCWPAPIPGASWRRGWSSTC